METEFGNLVLLSATDICKDRLAAYFYWQDEQSLSQAINIASANTVDINGIKEWADAEGMIEKLNRFLSAI